MASISVYMGRTWELSSLSASAGGWVRGITSGAACLGLDGAVAQPAARHDTPSAMPRMSNFDDVMDLSTLGVLVGYRLLNQCSRWRRALDGRHHRRILRQACRHFDVAVIGQTDLDGDAGDAIVVNGVDEVTVAIGTHRRRG